MSSAQERPAGRAGTTDPTGGSAAAGAGDTAGRTAAAGTGTPGYEHVGAHRGADYQEADYRETAGWEEGSAGRAGGVMLAAALMIFAGLVTFFYGIVGVIHGTFFTTTVSNYVFSLSPRGRGWVELILGAVVFMAGVCVLLGMLWARIVGVVLAVLSAIANFMFLPWYPVWSIIVIALDVFIIWALSTGGRERRTAGR